MCVAFFMLWMLVARWLDRFLGSDHCCRDASGLNLGFILEASCTVLASIWELWVASGRAFEVLRVPWVALGGLWVSVEGP